MVVKEVSSLINGLIQVNVYFNPHFLLSEQHLAMATKEPLAEIIAQTFGSKTDEIAIAYIGGGEYDKNPPCAITITISVPNKRIFLDTVKSIEKKLKKLFHDTDQIIWRDDREDEKKKILLQVTCVFAEYTEFSVK